MSDVRSGLSLSLDISTAFDAVWHPTLLPKLSAYGIQGQLHTWLPDFLYSRSGSQRNLFNSSPCRGWSTLRQGSGPSPIPNLHQ